MTDYLATFHTHLAALKTHRAMTAAGLTARMAPVCRVKAWSDLTACVFYRAEEPGFALLDGDTEAVYRLTDGGAELLRQYE